MKKKIIFIVIILLAATLRLYRLGENPPAVYGDEQAFAWNAWNILHTAQDEYGNFLPLQFKSFNDYKSPVPVYLLVPFLKIFDLTPWSTRLPVAISGVFSVVITYFLVKLFLPSPIALLASFLLAISSWHIHLSRGFFEANLALTFFLLGIYFFFKAGKKPKYLIISSIFLVITLYTYFTPRILLPLFIVFLFLYNRDWVFKIKRYLLLFCFLLFIFSLPLLKMALFEKGATRMQELMGVRKEEIEKIVSRERYGSIAPEKIRLLMHNKVVIWLREFKNNYLEHLSLNFWYLYGDSSLRYFTGNTGMFYLFELPFFILGVNYLFKKYKKVALFFLIWIFLAPIPASLVGRPFAVRSLAMLPAPFIFVACGIFQFWQLLKKKRLEKLGIIFLCFGFGISLGSYLLRYWLDYPAYAATWWGWENKTAIDYAKKHQEEYEKIFITNYYSGTELAFAFYEKLDPLYYRKAIKNPVSINGFQFIQFGKFYIGSFALDDEALKSKRIPPKSLYIGGPMEPGGESMITDPADRGRTLFKTYDTLNKECYKLNLPRCD